MQIKKIAKILTGIFVSFFVIAGGVSWYVLEKGRQYMVEATEASAPR